MGLDLYAKIEPFLDFDEEVYNLHKEFMALVMEKELDNILDIGCGQGYFLENLSLNNKTAFGIDLSQAQIDACKQRGIENVTCTALEYISKKYDCATAIFDVLNYIPRKELKKFLCNTNDILNDNGYFIFDVNSHFGFDEVAQGAITIDVDDKFIGIDAVFEERKLLTQITLFSKDKNGKYEKEKDTITQYYHDIKTFKELLKKAGFEIESIIEFNLHGFDEADKLIYVCKKLTV